MQRSLIHSLLLGVSTLLLVGNAALAQEMRLKSEVAVSSDTIRLDQLIENAGKLGETAMFRAPLPGGRGTIRTDRILLAAREMGLTGIDTGSITAVTITRPGRTIARTEMEEHIARAANERGVLGDLAVLLDEHVTTRLVDANRMDALKTVSFVRDARANRFEARLMLAGAPDGSEAWIVTGSIVETREIAVPAIDLERGDAIQAKDLILIKRPASQVAGEIIRPASELIGMVPRRALKAGEPVRQADVAKPILVDKNQLVTVVYSTKGLNLSMRGRAQSSGTMGESIKVQNPQSKRMLEGTVSGPGQITISPITPTATLAEATTAARR